MLIISGKMGHVALSIRIYFNILFSPSINVFFSPTTLTEIFFNFINGNNNICLDVSQDEGVKFIQNIIVSEMFIF
jgi:hypothetical protein